VTRFPDSVRFPGEGPGGEGDSYAVTPGGCLSASGRALRERFGKSLMRGCPLTPEPLSPLRRGEPNR
jgi:hypothetical protein